MLKVSVIIPICNAEAYLSPCLDSVCKQHFQNLEILLVDDASTDRSPQICAEYAQKDSRICILRHDQPLGAAAARNTALDAATGEFLYFLDSDLWIEPGCISRLAKVMIDDKADMSVCSFVVEYPDKSHPNYFSYVPFGVWNSRKWIETCYKAASTSDFLWNRMFKRKMFTGLRFEQGRTYSEIPVITEMTELCISSASFDRVLIHQIRRPDSLERSTVTAPLFDKIWAFEQKKALFDQYYPDLAYLVERQIADTCLTILRQRAVFGAEPSTEAQFSQVLERLIQTTHQKPSLPWKLRLQVQQAINCPRVFSASAKRYKFL